MLKMKNPDVVVPTVYRVGGTEIIPQAPSVSPDQQQIPAVWAPAASPSTGQTRHYAAGYRPAYAPRDGYQPAYIKSQTCMSVPVPKHAMVEEEAACQHEEDRATTPRPVERTLSFEEFEQQNPFADPVPMIAPIETVATERSLVSSFNASFEDRMKEARGGSPLAEAAEREKSLLEGFLDPPKDKSEEVSGEQETRESLPQTPSFVSDVLEDFFKTVSKRKELERNHGEAEMAERKVEPEEALSTLVSGVSRLVAMVKGETPIAESPVAEEGAEETSKLEEPEKKGVEVEEEQVLSTLVQKVAVSEPEKIAEEPKVKIEVVVQQEEEVEKKDVTPAAPPLSAGFVVDVTVPDGQVFPPGAEFMKCWRMTNDGPIDWPETTEVVFVAGEPSLVKVGNEAVKVGVVKAGEQVDVWTGELKAPEVVGRYVGYWRLRDSATKTVFGNSIWAEIEVAEADHLSDESSLSGSSIVRMPTGLGIDAMSDATSVRPQSLTLTIPSSGSTTTGGGSDIGSDVSLIDDDMSDGETAAWEDARSRVVSSSVVGSAAPPAAPVTPGSPLGDDFELVYDSGSDM
jgi:next-to-BRCA1 protein 1